MQTQSDSHGLLSDMFPDENAEASPLAYPVSRTENARCRGQCVFPHTSIMKWGYTRRCQ